MGFFQNEPNQPIVDKIAAARQIITELLSTNQSLTVELSMQLFDIQENIIDSTVSDALKHEYADLLANAFRNSTFESNKTTYLRLASLFCMDCNTYFEPIKAIMATVSHASVEQRKLTP